MEKDTIASINTTGIITNSMSNQLGEITSSGVIKNAQGETLGNIVGNKFIDISGIVRGEKIVAGNETQLKAGGDVIIATVQSGNKIIDSNNTVLLSGTGTVSENQLIAYFLFF
ncbi:MAG: hypothetical protein CVT95_08880 [Bacteroidetes bacterium HGW-Bacteroidetes-12]|nr:MAG: hypothetical protein CVT95_08880 [Bacteroidetes bacterium HGW-Bacteroidetes-12]